MLRAVHPSPPRGGRVINPRSPAGCCRSLFFILLVLYCLFAVNQYLQFRQVGAAGELCAGMGCRIFPRPNSHLSLAAGAAVQL